MAFIAREFIQNRIERLVEKRDEAVKNKNYKKVWELNMKIDKNMNRLVTFSY